MSDAATECVIALGGNVGPVERTFETALDRLEHAGCRLLRRSRDYRSVPMGTEAGSRYTNAVALLATKRSPLELLDLLQEVEHVCGRERTVHWGPRTLDLDLLFYGQQLVRLPQLTVPHPGIWYRRFVLDPLAEIAPDLVHPDNGQSVQQLRSRLQQRPLVIELEGVHAVPAACGSYIDRLVQIRLAGGRSALSSDTQEVFCRVCAEPAVGRKAAAWQVDSQTFRIVVPATEVGESLDAVVAAALGELSQSTD